MSKALRALGGLFRKRRRHGGRRIGYATRVDHLRIESLESRCVLASTGLLPAMTGTVFQDVNNNGTLDAGEALSGAIVRLFADDGDGLFEPGTDDLQVGADFVTLSDNLGTPENETGTYCFDNLDPDASYFVQQPSQPVGAIDLPEMVSDLLTPGIPDLLIDEFQSRQITSAGPLPPLVEESVLLLLDETEVIGRERDLVVQFLSGSAEVQLRVNPFGQRDVLSLDSASGSQGSGVVTWDGPDEDAGELSMGLGGRDLTFGGTATGIMLRAGVDNNGGGLRVRLYQGDATNFSEASEPIPVTGGDASGFVFLPFSAFAGGVSPTDVDAIQLFIDSGTESVDMQIDVIGSVGPEVQDFANGTLIDLELAKQVDRSTADNGETVTWTVSVTNNATSATFAATGVEVTDAIPSGLTFVQANTANGSFDNDTGIWTLSSPLAPGETGMLTLVTTVNDGVTGGTTIENVAQVSAANEMDVDSMPNNNDGDQSEDDEDDATLTVNSVIDLEVTKTVTADVVIGGDIIQWAVTVLNNGEDANATATGVQVRDVLPAGVTFVDANAANGTYDDGSGLWTLTESLPPDASATLIIATTVDSNVAGGTTIANVAEVVAANEPDFDSLPNNDDGNQSEDDEDVLAIMVNPVIDLEVTKMVSSDVVNNGDTVQWVVTVMNDSDNANSPATGVQVTDVLPNGLVFNDASTLNGTYDSGDGVWTLADPLDAGDVAILTLTTTVDGGAAGGTTIMNIAEVSGANEMDFDSTPGNDDGDQSEDDEDIAAITVNPVIDLELTKSAASDAVDNGDSVQWTITVLNNGENANSAATGVQVADTLPSGITFVEANASNGSFDAGTGIWTLADPLAPNASATLTVDTTVDEDVAGGTTLANIAQVSAANESDADSMPANDSGDQSEDDEDNATITVNPVIDLELSKNVDRTTVRAGDEVTWTVTVLNNSLGANTSATGVEVHDELPAGVTFVDADTTHGSFNEDTGIWTFAEPLPPGQTANLSIITTVEASATGSNLINFAEVSAANETDIDSVPNPTVPDSTPASLADSAEDDEDSAAVLVRPISKRDLLASSGRDSGHFNLAKIVDEALSEAE